MRALLQRVASASVATDGRTVATIGPGLLVLLAVGRDDDEGDARWIAAKLPKLRIFDDDEGRMNHPLGKREILCISQFTLYGDVRKGNRPAYTDAAPSEPAEALYGLVCGLLGAERGLFGAQMRVELINDGPVTLMVESP